MSFFFGAIVFVYLYACVLMFEQPTLKSYVWRSFWKLLEMELETSTYLGKSKFV